MKRGVLGMLLALQLAAHGLARGEGPHPPSPRRTVPDYDGRPPPPPSPGDLAVWVPRIVLSPLYLVSEYVLRRPLSVLVPAAESADVPRKVYDFFTFGPKHEAGFFPVGLYDFDFNPSVGVYAFWNDAGFAGDDWHAHVEVWPNAWLGASLTERVAIGTRSRLQVRIEGLRRPDHVFYGIGPDAPQSSQSRYGEDRVDGAVVYEHRFWRSSRIETGLGVRAANLYDGSYGNDPGIREAAAAGLFALPPGFGGGYTAEHNDLSLFLDTRDAVSPGSGVVLALQAEQASDVGRSPASGWIRYAATAGGYVDLNGRGRVLGIGATTVFVDPIGNEQVPFTELASLGGDGPVRGYFTGRLVDRSAAAAEAHYTWPVAPWLAGTIEATLGNVFDEHLQGFRAGRARLSSDVGFSTDVTGDYPIEAVFGMGTETFERGATVDSFRLTVSVNHGL